MKKYWDTIFKAWQDTIVTEHEYFVAPAIYTPDVVEKLGTYLREAEASIQQMDARDGHLSRNEQRYLQRMRFMRLGYTVLAILYVDGQVGGDGCRFSPRRSRRESAVCGRATS